MKKLIFILFTLPFLVIGQEEKPAPSLFEVINITVKDGQADEFEAAVKAHNEEFHGADGMYNAFLLYNINGPLAGQYSWVMGPTNWTAMDDRPGEGAHDDHWEAVHEHVESYEGPTYWKLSVKLSHIAREEPYPKRMVWVYDIKPGKWARWSELVGKVQEVYIERMPDESYWVVMNQFADSEKGWDAAIIWGFDKWAWLDDESPFAVDYEAVHGPGSWHNFLNEFMETVDGRVDFIREVVE